MAHRKIYNMANKDHINKIKEGYAAWNSWRTENPDIIPELCDIDFVSEFPDENGIYNLPNLENYNFSNCNLRRVSFRNCTFINCNFDNADIHFSDFVDGFFQSCSFNYVGMRVCKIGFATFSRCSFIETDLSYCSAEETSFVGSDFKLARLEHMSLVNNDFTNTTMEECFIYGISSWDLITEDSVHSDLIITRDDQQKITVDNLELAQFIYMMINDKRLRDIIDTITSKVVLILGNFNPERKMVLDDLRKKLREFDFIPVLFDFDKPSSRNLTETVYTLAHISKFVIFDLSTPRSIAHEVSTIIPRLPSVNFYPIIVSTEREYSMFQDLEKNYTWVKPIKKYTTGNHLEVLDSIIKEEKK